MIGFLKKYPKGTTEGTQHLILTEDEFKFVIRDNLNTLVLYPFPHEMIKELTNRIFKQCLCNGKLHIELKQRITDGG